MVVATVIDGAIRFGWSHTNTKAGDRFDVSNNNLDSTALDEIYTNASATGAGKTITVTGNWGAANSTIGSFSPQLVKA